jgi:hypothetical protein
MMVEQLLMKSDLAQACSTNTYTVLVVRLEGKAAIGCDGKITLKL